MNPELLNRIQAGAFVRLVLNDEASISGYAAANPEEPGTLRLDGYWLNEQGQLQQVSLRIQPEEIAAVHFLPESPSFQDREGNSIRMEPGFFKHLD